MTFRCNLTKALRCCDCSRTTTIFPFLYQALTGITTYMRDNPAVTGADKDKMNVVEEEECDEPDDNNEPDDAAREEEEEEEGKGQVTST